MVGTHYLVKIICRPSYIDQVNSRLSEKESDKRSSHGKVKSKRVTKFEVGDFVLQYPNKPPDKLSGRSWTNGNHFDRSSIHHQSLRSDDGQDCYSKWRNRSEPKELEVRSDKLDMSQKIILGSIGLRWKILPKTGNNKLELNSYKIAFGINLIGILI